MNAVGDTGSIRLLSWSGGKDAMYAWHRLAGQSPPALLVSYSEATGRLPHSGVSLRLVEAQARSLGAELVSVAVPEPWDETRYGARMAEALTGRLRPGDAVAFGDLYLTGLRQHREERMSSAGYRATFPAWTDDTRSRAEEIWRLGVRALVVSVDSRILDPGVLGEAYSSDWVDALPNGVDPCGENGEFQTFVVDGPGFTAPVDVRPGERVEEGDYVTLCLDTP